MRTVIFAVVVAVLAGACWVVAQNASSQGLPSPYRAIPAPKPKAAPPAERITSPMEIDPILAPTTELDPIASPPTKLEPLSKVELPPAVEPPPQIAPPVEPPPHVTAPPVEPPVTAAPVVQQAAPPGPRSLTTPALPGLPPLPEIPGLPSDPPTVRNYTGPPPQGNGPAVIIPERLNSPEPRLASGPGDLPPPVKNPNTPWQVDDPNAWNGRQQFPVDSCCDHLLGPRVWFSAEYLMWFVKRPNSPTLVQAVVGASATSSVFSRSQIVDLYPANSIDFDPLEGVRGTVGFWFNRAQTIGLESSYFWFDTSKLSDSFVGSTNTILGRPFVNADTGIASLLQVSTLKGTSGQISVNNSLRVDGGEANLIFNPEMLCQRLTLMAGFRYFEMNERLRINSFSANTNTNVETDSIDSFSTRNQFYGGQAGLRWTYQGNRLFASFTGKIALGTMEEHVGIEGGTVASINGVAVASAPGALLAQTTNIGSYSRSRLAFIPEANATIGYRITPHASIFVGYNFMYISDVVRPGRQIDTSVSAGNLPFSTSTGSSSPAFRYHGEDTWLQGVNLGLTFQY
jgi:hypothetical protein